MDSRFQLGSLLLRSNRWVVLGSLVLAVSCAAEKITKRGGFSRSRPLCRFAVLCGFRAFPSLRAFRRFLFQHRRQPLREEPSGQHRLLRGVPGSPHLQQQRPGGGVLVIPGVPQQHRAHQRGILLQDVLLHRRRQPEVLQPARVLQSAAVAADDQGHLGRNAQALHLRHRLVLVPLPVLNGVPVDVQDKADGGIPLQVLLNGGQRPVIGPGVIGVVIQRPVVEDGDARLSQNLRYLVPHPHHVIAVIRSPVIPGPDDFRPRNGGVRLAAVGM